MAELDIHKSEWGLRSKIVRTLWMLARGPLFRASFHNWYGWRRFVLRCFGATVGKGVRVRPTVRIEMPWNLVLQDDCIIGDYAILYSLGRVTIGPRTVISQYAHLCAGTHDYTSRKFPLVKMPITIGQDCWIATDVFVGPGVTVADRSVVGARSNVLKDIPPDSVAVGSPAKVIKPRVLKD
jgi:putative colanic acid biosynthesis acetyltransferase WcaF